MVTISNIQSKKSVIPKRFHADIPTIIELSKSELSKDKEVTSVIEQLLKLINNEMVQPKTKAINTKSTKVQQQKNKKNVVAKPLKIKAKPVNTKSTKVQQSSNPPKAEVSSLVLDYPIKEIFTDEKRFQNRSKLNEDTVNQIVKNFNPTKFDPIIVWQEPSTKKTFVLAGHHRLEAMKVLKRKSVEVKFLTATEAEAIHYAKVESNANRTMENDYERAKIYRNLRFKGTSKKLILEQAREIEGKNANTIVNLSYLKQDGLTIQALQQLDKADKQNKSTIEKIADWIGEALKTYEKLDYSHEKEMFDFLNDFEQSKRIKSKSEFIQKITAIAGGFDFDGTERLNLKRLKYKSQGESVYEDEYKEIESKINAILDKKVELKEKINILISSGKKESEYKEQLAIFENLTVKANEDIKFYQGKLLELSRNKSKYTSAGQNQAALFGVKKKTIAMKPMAKPKPQLVDKEKLNATVPVAPSIRTSGKIKSINETGKQQNNFYKVNGAVGEFLQQVERKPFESVVITLDGMQGAGKTTTLYKFIDAFASAGNSSLFISGEEHPESSLAVEKRDKYLSNAAKQNTAIVGDVESVEQLYQYVKPYDIIFIDSWQKLQRMVGNIRLDEDLRKKFNGKVFVVIFQQTTTGRTKGGAEVVFDGDIIIKMVKEASFSDNYAYFDKNRYTKIPIENIRYNIASGEVYNPNQEVEVEEQITETARPVSSSGFAFQI